MMLNDIAAHGGDIYGISEKMNIRISECIDFSANINPLGVPASVREAMQKSLDTVINYPDFLCRKLCEAIADKHSLIPENIICGNGAADIIYRIVQALKPKKALIAEPTFSEYKAALELNDTYVKTYNMTSDFEICENIIYDMSDDIDIMFLCNPNNPTGVLIDKDFMDKILKTAVRKNITVILDECFMDFVRDKEYFTMLSEINNFDNIIILKSFTKMYSIPGIRLGYAVCSNIELTEKIRHAGQSWSVNSVAQAAGIAALKECEYEYKTAEYIEKEKIIIAEELRNLGFKVWDGKANYLFFKAEKYPDLYHRMLLYKIVIRSCANYTGLTSEYFRIAIKNHKENELLLSALKEIAV